MLGEFLLRVLVRLDHLDGEWVFFMNQKNENRNLPLDRAIEFHLGDGDFVPFGFMAVAPREDANVNVRLVHYFERHANGVGIARAGRCSMPMGKMPSRRQALTTFLRCLGRSIDVLRIIAVSWPGLFIVFLLL